MNKLYSELCECRLQVTRLAEKIKQKALGTKKETVNKIDALSFGGVT